MNLRISPYIVEGTGPDLAGKTLFVKQAVAAFKARGITASVNSSTEVRRMPWEQEAKLRRPDSGTDKEYSDFYRWLTRRYYSEYIPNTKGINVFHRSPHKLFMHAFLVQDWDTISELDKDYSNGFLTDERFPCIHLHIEPAATKNMYTVDILERRRIERRNKEGLTKFDPQSRAEVEQRLEASRWAFQRMTNLMQPVIAETTHRIMHEWVYLPQDRTGFSGIATSQVKEDLYKRMGDLILGNFRAME